MLHIGTSETLLVPSFLQVDLTLVDAMLTLTPTERLGWLEDALAPAETFRSDLERPSPGIHERP
jgi:hypothetical protein